VGLRSNIRKLLLESSEDEPKEEDTTLLKALRLYSKGKIDENELLDSDVEIFDVMHGGKSSKAEHTIIFDLGEDKTFFDLLDINEDDGWFARVVSDRYSNGYDFMDSYQVEDDFKEGYIIFGELNEDNKKSLEEILIYLTGKKPNLNSNQSDIDSENAKLLLHLFPSEMDDILSEYAIQKDYEMNKTAKESIEKELNDFLSSIGFRIYREYDEISTTPINLIMWYSRLNVETMDFISLFKKIIENTNTDRLGGWLENSYEFQNSEYFDSESFNNFVERKLESILEGIKDGDFDVEGFMKMLNKITSKFAFETWYDLPKDKRYQFFIKDISRETLNISLRLRNKKNHQQKDINLSEDGFNNFLYQPELFGLSDIVPESIEESFDPIHFLKKKI